LINLTGREIANLTQNESHFATVDIEQIKDEQKALKRMAEVKIQLLTRECQEEALLNKQVNYFAKEVQNFSV
jgi:hypothetical protein